MLHPCSRVLLGNWLFDVKGDYDRVKVHEFDVRSSLRLAETLVGRVIACQVTSGSVSSGNVSSTATDVETLLMIAPETRDDVYR